MSNAYANRVSARLLPLLVCVTALMACGPTDKQREDIAQRKRIECLDKLCEGDVEPNRNMETEVALKLNGQWYIGPKEYFSTGKNGGGFYWPSRHPMFKGGDYPERRRVFSTEAIEIFLAAPQQAISGKGLYQRLLEMEKRGEVLEKKMPRPGLEIWRTHETGLWPETWYVATLLKEPGGDPPVIACRGNDPTRYPCTTGFVWRPDIAASMRFLAAHGPSWPEIYVETARILNLLRKA